MIANQLKDSFKRSCTYILDAEMVNTLLWLIHLQLQLGDFPIWYINEEIWQILIVWPIVLQVDLQKAPGIY
jgi:hypothetical protein